MMKKIAIISILVLSLFLLTACKGEQPATTAKGAFLGGTQGITADFEAFGVEEGGIYSIFDEESFLLEVTLRNKGEYNIKPGEAVVKLLGPSHDEFSGMKSWELKNSGSLDAISDLVPAGGEETLTFATDAKYVSEVTGVIDREWFANVEYRYQTFLIIPEVCLKEDLADERVCKVKEAKQHSVSGAPVTVKSVEEDTAGKGIMALKILVSNAGNGKITMPGQEFGVRDALTYSLDDPAWECKSGGRINEARLVDGQAEIICRLVNALPEGHISTKQVKLTLDYKYRDLIRETLRIKQSS